MRVIAIANQKGGCGKTTTSINFAACLAFLQKKILLVDLDPQGHSACGLGVRAEKISSSLFDRIDDDTGQKPLADPIIPIESHLFLIPSERRLGSLEEKISRLLHPQIRLRKWLQNMSFERTAFDYVIIDCPPNFGLLTLNALYAADEILIPIEPSLFSLHGLAKMSETLRSINERRSIPLRVHALLVLFDSRTSFAKEVYEDVKAHFREKLFTTIIHESVALKEAASAGQSIVRYDPHSNAFKDYLHLAVEYLEREWDRLLPQKELGWRRILEHRYGPRRMSGGVLFQVVSKNARGVEIAGDFNNWIPESLLNRRWENGLWQKIIPMKAGQFRYKFIVDGEWQLDPYQPLQKQNAFGTMDSYLEVA